jgi:glycosyltransferase involved in cell wall biosynthesis
VIGYVPDSLASRLRNRFPWATFCGFVDDIGQELQNARVAIVPEETGGGFKLKILDYIFGRVPIAALESALNGIPSLLKSHFMVARDLEALVAKIIKTIDNTRRLNVMQSKAFALAEGAFDWDANGTKLLKTVESELRHRSASVGTRQLRLGVWLKADGGDADSRNDKVRKTTVQR